MAEGASLEFRLRKVDETGNYVLHEMKHNNLMSEKYKKMYQYLNYVKHLLVVFQFLHLLHWLLFM